MTLKIRTLEFNFYVILNAKKSGIYYYTGTTPRVSQKMPSLQANEIAVKLKLIVDERHFTKPTMEIVGMVDYHGEEKATLHNKAREAATIVGEMLDLKINVLE